LLIRAAAACVPVALTLFYGILVTSPAGEAAKDSGLHVEADPRVELAAILGRVAGDDGTAWPIFGDDVDGGAAFRSHTRHPAVIRVREWRRKGGTSPKLLGAPSARSPPAGRGPGGGRRPGVPPPPGPPPLAPPPPPPTPPPPT